MAGSFDLLPGNTEQLMVGKPDTAARRNADDNAINDETADSQFRQGGTTNEASPTCEGEPGRKARRSEYKIHS